MCGVLNNLFSYLKYYFIVGRYYNINLFLLNLVRLRDWLGCWALRNKHIGRGHSSWSVKNVGPKTRMGG